MDRIQCVDAEINYYPRFLPPQMADSLLCKFRHSIKWQQHVVTLFGRRINSPRLSAWYGDKDAYYSYSGQDLTPTTWTPQLEYLRQHVSQICNKDFNSALLNFYRDGSDSMGWHSDDERSLGTNPTIASISLGAERRFVMRHKHKPNIEKIEYSLGNGDLLVMMGPTQRNWKHHLPKTVKLIGPRINLTFRSINSWE